MKIVVDLQSNQSGSRKGGIGRYSFDLLTAMIQSRPDWDFRVVLNDLFPERTNEIRYRLRNFVPQSSIHVFKVPRNISALNGNSQLAQASEFLREKFISELNPDVIHVSSVVEGLSEDVVISVKKFFDIPTVSTLYDLIPLVKSDLYLSNPGVLRSHYFSSIRKIRKSDGLLAISEYSADEMRAIFPGYGGKITNIKGGIGQNFTKRGLNSSVVDLRRRYDLRKKIILYTASFDQRKNQAGLIEAFATLPRNIRASHQLVFVGNGWAGIYDRLLALGQARGLGRDDIRFLGHVPDADLIWLYNICDVFVFPPKWEGLGMPALEARACGAVVIGANTTSIPEVIGWEEALFDPDDSVAIGQKILRAIVDQEFREENRVRGRDLVAQYQWNLSAAVANGAIEEIVKARRGGIRQPGGAPSVDAGRTLADVIFAEELTPEQAQELSFCAAANDMSVGQVRNLLQPKRGWITTWNSRCGIATYSEHLLNETDKKPIILAPYIEKPIAGEKEKNVVRCWSEGKNDNLIELETAVYESNITELVIQFNYGFFDIPSLRGLIERFVSKGITIYFILHSTIDQDARHEQRLPAFSSALQLANGIFVHSENDVRRLAELGLTSHVALLPHGIPHVAGSLGKAKKPRAMIASYGFFLPGKGLLELIEAIALLAKERPIDLRMVNALYKESTGVSQNLVDEAMAKIEELGLEGNVRIYSDFLSDEESYELISSADIVVYPYTKTGESASGAVRLGLATNQLVAVSPLPIFDDVRSSVYTLPSIDSAGIATGLARALDLLQNKDPEVEAIKRNSQRLVEFCSYKNIANSFDRYLTMWSQCITWYDLFRFELSSKHVLYGFVSQGRLISQGAGVLCHGPYINLDPGIYRLTVYGEGAKRSGSIKLRFTANCGGMEIECHELDGGIDGILFDTVICVSQKINDAEFLFETTQDAQLSLATYSLSKRSR